MEPDPRLDQILAITKDTNRMVHKMRRSMLWGRFFYIVIWIVMIFGPVAAYYFYFQSYVKPYMAQLQQFEALQPYMKELQQFQAQLQASNQTTQNYQSEISSFFGNILQQGGTGSTSIPTSTKH